MVREHLGKPVVRKIKLEYEALSLLLTFDLKGLTVELLQNVPVNIQNTYGELIKAL